MAPVTAVQETKALVWVMLVTVTLLGGLGTVIVDIVACPELPDRFDATRVSR